MIAALCLVLAAAPPAGSSDFAPASVQGHVDPGQVHLGEPFTYTLVLTHPKDARYELHPGPDLGAFELLSQDRNRADGPDQATTTFRLKMSAFELGKKTLPHLTFDVSTEKGTGQYVAQGAEVDVLSSLPQDAQEQGEDLFDIKPNELVPVRTYRVLWGLAGLLAAAALGYAAYRFWKRPRRAPVVAPEPPKPLHVRTLALLDALRAEDLPGQGRVKDFHFRLSEILRGYLGERYAFEALECTSAELIDALRRLRTPGLPLDQVTGLVQASDLVKFAKAPAGLDECKRAIELAYHVVSLTVPAPNASGPRVQ